MCKGSSEIFILNSDFLVHVRASNDIFNLNLILRFISNPLLVALLNCMLSSDDELFETWHKTLVQTIDLSLKLSFLKEMCKNNTRGLYTTFMLPVSYIDISLLYTCMCFLYLSAC